MHLVTAMTLLLTLQKCGLTMLSGAAGGDCQGGPNRAVWTWPEDQNSVQWSTRTHVHCAVAFGSRLLCKEHWRGSCEVEGLGVNDICALGYDRKWQQ